MHGKTALHWKTLLLSCAACVGLGACASQPGSSHPRKEKLPLRDAGMGAPTQRAAAQPPEPCDDTPFSRHPSPTVRSAAQFGGLLVGSLVGIPASIVMIPVTYPLAAITKDKWTGLYPFGACYYAGGVLFGGVVAVFAPSSYAGEPKPTQPRRTNQERGTN